MRKLGVLVVDDQDDLREMVAELLMHEGYHSIMARSGEEALHKAADVKPDVVVTDFAMDGMNGAQLLAALAAAHGPIASVMITASKQGEAEAALADAGVQAVIVRKPFAIADLLDAIRRLSG